MLNTVCMAPKRKTKGDSEQYRKPARMARIPERMAAILEEVASEKETNLSDEVKQAVREYLERLGRWPIKKDDE